MSVEEEPVISSVVGGGSGMARSRSMLALGNNNNNNNNTYSATSPLSVTRLDEEPPAASLLQVKIKPNKWFGGDRESMIH